MKKPILPPIEVIHPDTKEILQNYNVKQILDIGDGVVVGYLLKPRGRKPLGYCAIYKNKAVAITWLTINTLEEVMESLKESAQKQGITAGQLIINRYKELGL